MQSSSNPTALRWGGGGGGEGCKWVFPTLKAAHGKL